VMLRVKNLTTAEILTNQLPQVQIYSLIPESRTNDSTDNDLTDFTSGTSDKLTIDKVPLVDPSDLVQLPKGQAFALIEGGQLYKIRLPLASKAQDIMMPADLQEVVANMRCRYDRYALAADAGQIEGLNGNGFDFGQNTPVPAHGLAGEPFSVTVEGKGSGF